MERDVADEREDDRFLWGPTSTSLRRKRFVAKDDAKADLNVSTEAADGGEDFESDLGDDSDGGTKASTVAAAPPGGDDGRGDDRTAIAETTAAR
mmetsp:Transcript_12279/g.26555  ORF Transcript_12279/g.26555 Transcript_12279/m.26555 type:complete len:94 (+) Transcript_12279:2461-2742(+)